jgi:hypothetical protein
MPLKIPELMVLKYATLFGFLIFALLIFGSQYLRQMCEYPIPPQRAIAFLHPEEMEA